MKSETEFDAYLTSQLQEPELPDHGFTRAVAARLEQHRRRRRIAFAFAFAVPLAIVMLALSLSPAPLFSVATITPENTVAVLLLATFCSLVWIGTESGTATRVS